MSYKTQTMSDKEADQSLNPLLKEGEEFCNFVQAQVNEWKDDAGKSGEAGVVYLLVNLTHQITEDSPGENAKGRKFRDSSPFKFRLTGPDGDIVDDDDRNVMHRGMLLRVLQAYYGGRGRELGDYPVGETGEKLHPVAVLCDEANLADLQQRRARVLIGMRTYKDRDGEDVKVNTLRFQRFED